MGLCIFKMEQMTPRQFQNYVEGYLQHKDTRMRGVMTRWRMLCFYAAAGNLKKGTTPEKLIPFPWENPDEPQADPVTEELSGPEAVKRANEYWENIDKKRG